MGDHHSVASSMRRSVSGRNGLPAGGCPTRSMTASARAVGTASPSSSSMHRRAAAMPKLLRSGHETGRDPWASMFALRPRRPLGCRYAVRRREPGLDGRTPLDASGDRVRGIRSGAPERRDIAAMLLRRSPYDLMKPVRSDRRQHPHLPREVHRAMDVRRPSSTGRRNRRGDTRRGRVGRGRGRQGDRAGCVSGGGPRRRDSPGSGDGPGERWRRALGRARSSPQRRQPTRASSGVPWWNSIRGRSPVTRHSELRRLRMPSASSV